MTAAIRTRFAPSPTGALHLGNIRTAVLNWLYARHHEGSFVLRIEDTDTARNVPDGEAMIYEALDWLALVPDEGPREGGSFGPYRQSERTDRQVARALGLLDSGHAFRCYCTPAELEARRAEAIETGGSPGRDPRCRDLSDAAAAELESRGHAAAIRLRVESGPVEFEDRLKGTLSIDGDDLGDMVLVRADGRPTYNFAVAVDDLEMEISHVIRGVGHLSNTPKQMLLYRALGVTPPQFIHIPTVLAPGGGKLSKRKGAISLLEYRDRGYHPDAILNYLSLLSWSSEDGEEFLTRQALTERIDLDRLGAADTEVDEEKMTWLSGQHLRSEPASALAGHWEARAELEHLALDSDDLVRAAEVFAKRIQLFSEAVRELEPIFGDPGEAGAETLDALAGPEAANAIRLAQAAWEGTPWRPDALKSALQEAAGLAGIPGRAFYPPVRAALTGETHGPDLGEVAYALGALRTRERFTAALERAENDDTEESV